MNGIINFVKTLWIVTWWTAGSLVLWFPIGIAGLIGRSGRISFRLCQAWMWTANKITFVKVTARGLENVDSDRSYVIMSNHQSFLDIPALMLKVGVPFRWVIKKEFKYVPLFGWGLYLARHIFIDRSHPKQAIKSMGEAVKNLPPGIGVAVFPEGTRSADGVLREFKPGGFLMAIRAGIPILPVTINGSWRIMPNKRSLVFHPGPIELVIGKPIETAGCTRKDLAALMEKTGNRIRANLDPEFPAKK